MIVAVNPQQLIEEIIRSQLKIDDASGMSSTSSARQLIETLPGKSFDVF
jgi:hypothetical protein